MSFNRLVVLGATLALVSACGESPSEPRLLDADLSIVAANNDDDDDDDGRVDGIEVEVEGEGIRRPLFGFPFTTLEYSFEVESENGETEGEVSGRAFNAEGDFQEVRGVITCVSVVDEPPHGLVARLGAVITESESNVRPDVTGSQAVWTVAPGEDGSAQSTFVFIDSDELFPTLVDFHCGPGILVSQFLGGFSPVEADIEIEVD